MQVAKLNKKRKKRKARVHGKRDVKDPLRSFDKGADMGLDGVADKDDDVDDEFAEYFEDGDNNDKESSSNKRSKTDPTDNKIFTNTQDGTGKSTAGRNKWKERHKKGKFSNKKRPSERKKYKTLGI